MQRKWFVSGLSFGAILLAALWLIFQSCLIGMTLFPKEGMLVEAFDGSRVEVQENSLKIISGSAGMVRFSPLIIPSLALPFILVVGFAIYGCFALGRIYSLKQIIREGWGRR